MLFIANWLVLFVFWFFAFRAWRHKQTKLAIVCAVLWLTGRAGSVYLGINGGLVFIVYAAVLCLILIYADLIHAKLPARKLLSAEELLAQDQSNSERDSSRK